MKFNIEQLKQKLSKHGSIEAIKEGVVFTLLLSGTGLTNWKTVAGIQKEILEYAGEKYPTVEVMKNDETFFLLVLAPKTN